MKSTRTILIKLFLFFLSFNSFGQNTWHKFSHKNGFVIELPEYFSEGLIVAGGTLQYFDNSLDSQIIVCVESWGNGTKEELMKSYKSDLNSYKGITYKVFKDNWYVISGQNEEVIYYEKSINRGGVRHHLMISYPIKLTAVFENILGRISASFKE